jgi:hypothetical protein
MNVIARLAIERRRGIAKALRDVEKRILSLKAEHTRWKPESLLREPRRLPD